MLAQQLENLYCAEELIAIHEAIIIGEHVAAMEVVQGARQHGLDVILLSNTNELHWSRVSGFPSIRLIGSQVVSHKERVAKPDPAAFRRIEEVVRVPVSSILYLDDQAQNVAAAAAMGWCSRQVLPGTDALTLLRCALDTQVAV